MNLYWGSAMLLCFGIQLLLLSASAKMYPLKSSPWRFVGAAVLTSACTGICLSMQFSGSFASAIHSLALLTACAIGFGKQMPCWGIYLLLNLAINGAAASMKRGGVLPMLLSAAVVLGLSILSNQKEPDFIPVKIWGSSGQVTLKALRDTGNTLRDPISGDSVIIIASEAAQKLTGLTCRQIEDPIGTMGKLPIPGLRMIPYHAIGQKGGLLLAKRFSRVQIGKTEKSALVAFAPAGLEHCGFEALTGGNG